MENNWYEKRALKNQLWTLIKQFCEIVGDDNHQELGLTAWEMYADDLPKGISDWKSIINQEKLIRRI